MRKAALIALLAVALLASTSCRRVPRAVGEMHHITFIGDSIPEGNHLSAYTEAYPYECLKRVLEPGATPTYGTFTPWTGTEHTNKATGNYYTIYDAGIGSDYTSMMLARFETDVLGHTTNRVVIAGGIVDAVNGVALETSMGNLEAMADLAIGDGLSVTFTNLTPLYTATDAQHNAVYALSQAIEVYCAAEGFPCVDTYGALESSPGSKRMAASYAHDWVHPNELGNEVMADAFDLASLYAYTDYDLAAAFLWPLAEGVAGSGSSASGAASTVAPVGGNAGSASGASGTMYGVASVAGIAGSDSGVIGAAEAIVDAAYYDLAAAFLASDTRRRIHIIQTGGVTLWR